MLKQRYLTHFVLVIALLSVITSCRNASNTSGATTSDTVQFHSIVIRDSIFDSKKSSIIVDANISLPDANKQLFRLFTKELLGIIVVLDEKTSEKAVDFLLSQDILGIDTETRPCFTKGHHYKVALLQVSTHDTCFLFRLNFIGSSITISFYCEFSLLRYTAL